MTRHRLVFPGLLLAAVVVPFTTACGQPPAPTKPSPKKESPVPAASDSTPTPGRSSAGDASPKNPAVLGRLPDDAVPKTEAEWQKRLTAQQYRVTRQKATDPAFAGEYTDTVTPGTYRCICCGEPLFKSDEKFHSGCGWPSFTAPIDGVKGDTVAEHADRSHFMIRTEVTCRRCGAHLGHVFDDGPPPTGLRYCINSSAITLDAKTPAK